MHDVQKCDKITPTGAFVLTFKSAVHVVIDITEFD